MSPAERAAFLDSILASSTEHSIIAADLDGRIVSWNEGARRLYGYDAAEVIGQDLSLLHSPDSVRAGNPLRIREAVRASGSWSGEIDRHRKDGSGFTASVTMHLRKDAKGKPSGFTLISQDITEARRLSQEVRTSRDLLSRAIQASPHGVIVADPDASIVLVNQETCTIFGYSEQELVGQRVEILLPHALRAGHTDRHAAYQRAPGIRRMGHGRELKGLRKDGREIFVEIGLAPIPRDGVTYVLASIVDVTERKETRARLEWLSLAVEQSPIAVVMTDLDGHIEYVNAAFTKNTGYQSAEVLGKTPRILKSGETSPTVYRDLWAAIRAGRVWHGDLVNRRKDGTLYEDAMWVFPVTDAQGQVVRLLALKEDVTKKRSLEAQLRQAQRMESIGRLAGGVAHDFNNVLTAIFGYTELLSETLPPGSSQREDLEEIRKAAQRASGLTRQLLAFSRQQVLQPVVAETNDLVESLEKMLRRIVSEDIKLTLTLNRTTGNILVDPGQFDQVLMNLVVNARDAMPKGGSLMIETANADLDEQYVMEHQVVTPGRYVLISVSDTGSGIPPEVRSRIFEPFFTTKEIGKGTGLGLSTVYGIVKQSGGYVWVYSEVGKGTTFKIYLPRVDAPAVTGEFAVEPQDLRGTETVLLAEDDETLRALTTSVLRKLGYTVLAAGTPQDAQALARRREGTIHLLLTDVVMPGSSGRDLARELAKSRPGTKVLFISGYTGEAMIQHGLTEPGLNYLQKPYTPSVLAAKVREVLSKP
ncbi:MAG TPA: PAS domain S-box protein [Gemmatimonadales bacterium]|nr:PAS domain S-box protein [Gemmatimonadales bacterium]